MRTAESVFVDVLTAGAGGAEGVDADVAGLICTSSSSSASAIIATVRRGGCGPAPRFRHALHAVAARSRTSAWNTPAARNRAMTSFVAADSGLARRDDLDLPALPLGVARISCGRGCRRTAPTRRRPVPARISRKTLRSSLASFGSSSFCRSVSSPAALRPWISFLRPDPSSGSAIISCADASRPRSAAIAGRGRPPAPARRARASFAVLVHVARRPRRWPGCGRVRRDGRPDFPVCRGYCLFHFRNQS